MRTSARLRETLFCLRPRARASISLRTTNIADGCSRSWLGSCKSMARLKTDWVLFFAIVGLVGFGLIMVYSASSVIGQIKFHSPWHFFVRQILWAVASFVVLMYLKKADYRMMRTPTIAFAALGIVISLLVLVYFVDAWTHRWFRIPSVGSLQPSEFAKPALAVFLAYFVTARKDFINNRQTLKQAALAVAVL